MPRAARGITGMQRCPWLTGMLIGTAAGWIMQNSLCSVIAARLEGRRHDVS